jgi:hypothetical protein
MLRHILGKKTIAIIFTCVTLLSGCSNAPNTTAFQYKGHPIHPLLIKDLLPNLETNKSIGCINLDNQANYNNIETVTDSSTVNSGVWYLCHFSNTGYIDYHFVSVYNNYYCVIVRDIDGSFPKAYICFLSLKNKKLCLDGCVDVLNLRDDLVTISGDDLIIGSTKHSISTIIHSNINN